MKRRHTAHRTQHTAHRAPLRRPNPVTAERVYDRRIPGSYSDDGEHYARSRWETKVTPPKLSRGHFSREDVIEAAKAAQRLNMESYRLDGDRYARAALLGNGNFGMAYRVDTNKGPLVVKVSTATNMRGAYWTRAQQTRNMRQEAGIANELAAKGYSVVPRTVYVEIDGGTPALVREYGEPLQKMTGEEYGELERQLLEIERKHHWKVEDELSLYRRTDGTIFVGDVGFWRAPAVVRKGEKRRPWKNFDSSLSGLLERARKAHGVIHGRALPWLVETAKWMDSKAKQDSKTARASAFMLREAKEFIDDILEREIAGITTPLPPDVLRGYRAAQKIVENAKEYPPQMP